MSHSINCIGVDIKFPFEPYGVQRGMFGKLISSLTNKEHLLMESPTGTGKTLVLLCSALGWQAKSKELKQPLVSARLRQKFADERRAELEKRPCTCGKKDPICDSCEAIKIEKVFIDTLEDAPSSRISTKIPRIYYGTRTHKQISQVIRELNKTPYKKDLKMCILSSRERTCINGDVKDLPNRNDKCQDLVRSKTSMDRKKNNDSCPFYKDQGFVQSQFQFINDEFSDKAWDIEDASRFGERMFACPYYGARSLQQEADITFCPYNYLLDPTIRKSLDINLSGAVIIIDEAHNIEDICRESASFVIDTHQIDDILDAMKNAASFYIQGSKVTEACDFFKVILLDLKNFLVKFPFTPAEKGGQEYVARRVMNQFESLNMLKSLSLGQDCLAAVKENLKTLRGEDDDDQPKKSDDQEGSLLSFNQLSFLIQLTITLEFMYKLGSKHLNDFKLVVTQSLEREFYKFKTSGQRAITDGDDAHVWQLSLLCMNPGVAFEQIADKAWSIIVASGTLSPLESLKSELGCEFKNDFEGSHVVPKEQIFATILSKGPTNRDLNCTYTNSLQLPFQDEVGAIVRDVCKTVPNGVLCFFPSYDRMENLYQRWFTKGYIDEIQRSGKKLFREKKNLTPENFEKELQNYHRLAASKGALLFAVFRGKVSEGIDFADSAARAVITIGIPYPNFKEITVDLKRKYNDETRRLKPNLMTGGDWYASQGFRALNQALGRCIRHRGDWGAVIMIDSRLMDRFPMNSISKWIRARLNLQSDYKNVKKSLEYFVRERTSLNESKDIKLMPYPKDDYIDLVDDDENEVSDNTWTRKKICKSH